MPVRMHAHHLAAQFLRQIEIVDQVALPRQRNPIRSLPVALDVENRESGVEMRGHTRRFADDLPGPLLAAVDHRQDAAM